ncbi:MAG: hypothetical protein LQ351_006773 [Letrouitia transgressa]|nr:MAG: hypothetical protein LQ351_006773 [Letrouitia transgressa]
MASGQEREKETPGQRPPMAHIPALSLTQLPTRLSYTTSFLVFTPEDGAFIQASAPLIAPLIPTVLDIVYTKLLSYDITAAPFVPRQAPSSPSTSAHYRAPTSPADLDLAHPHIQHRKGFLRAYLLKIARNDDWTPTSPLWAYMDAIAVAHTGAAGAAAFKKRRPGGLRVEYMQLGLLLGYVADVVAGAVLGMEEQPGLDLVTKTGMVRAWGKLLWLQNDLFARRYVVDQETGERPSGWGSGGVGGIGHRGIWAGAMGAAMLGAGVMYGLTMVF